jgi:uncharacterized membrane protein
MSRDKAPILLACVTGLGLALALVALWRRRTRRRLEAAWKELPIASSVSELFIYPIKSCAGVNVDAAQIIRTGFLHDR